MAESKHEVARRAGDLVRRGYHCAEAMVLEVGGHLLGNLDPRNVRIATGFERAALILLELLAERRRENER